jgi:hypothetical protein
MCEPPQLAYWYRWGLTNILLRLASNYNSPDLHLPRRWDYCVYHYTQAHLLGFQIIVYCLFMECVFYVPVLPFHLNNQSKKLSLALNYISFSLQWGVVRVGSCDRVMLQVCGSLCKATPLSSCVFPYCRHSMDGAGLGWILSSLQAHTHFFEGPKVQLRGKRSEALLRRTMTALTMWIWAECPVF